MNDQEFPPLETHGWQVLCFSSNNGTILKVKSESFQPLPIREGSPDCPRKLQAPTAPQPLFQSSHAEHEMTTGTRQDALCLAPSSPLWTLLFSAHFGPYLLPITAYNSLEFLGHLSLTLSLVEHIFQNNSLKWFGQQETVLA
ncbi:hypothetical protein P7K49_012595 [Saguinus oedipus]|uniref:Uncharacterized protein n=1 Tax=Saguinus oedipus TaxID=9490 RepID=A0ABQ9VEE6_SAGOE|nr:hypothetical protein P7K49_012595 [Saguinus oedipus]